MVHKVLRFTDAPVAYDYEYTNRVGVSDTTVAGKKIYVVSVPDDDANYQCDRYRSGGFFGGTIDDLQRCGRPPKRDDI